MHRAHFDRISSLLSCDWLYLIRPMSIVSRIRIVLDLPKSPHEGDGQADNNCQKEQCQLGRCERGGPHRMLDDMFERQRHCIRFNRPRSASPWGLLSSRPVCGSCKRKMLSVLIEENVRCNGRQVVRPWSFRLKKPRASFLRSIAIS